jgi:hypothetical protein
MKFSGRQIVEASIITVGWHLIVKGRVDYTIRAMSSLQGLYDFVVIGVDSREDSDEVYEVLKQYPNVSCYRQNFEDFRHFGRMRQDVLDRVPVCSYIGRSDSDEVLISNPLLIRQWLAEIRPDAVNFATHYLHDVGWNKAGTIVREGSVRIWKYGTRRWGNPVHEYPYPISGPDEPVMSDFLFEHIKDNPDEYRADLHIDIYQKEIDAGDINFLFLQAKEYVVKGDINKAIALCFEFLKHGKTDSPYFELSLWGMTELCKGQGDYKGLLWRLQKLVPVIPKHENLIKYIEETTEVLDAS